MYKRMLAVMIAISLMLAVSAGRVLYLTTGGVSAAGSTQGYYTLTVTDARGTVYDCNMKRITNTSSKTVAVIPPTSKTVAAVTEQLKGRTESLLKSLKAGKPVLCEVPSDFRCDDAVIFNVDIGLSSDQIASHIVGYLDGDGNGVCGIQKAYNDLLREDEPLRVTYSVDASGRPLAGVSPEISGVSRSADGVVLTVDSTVQKIVEQEGAVLKKGAVVVMESKTGKIRAIASFPDYSPLSVAQCLNDASSPLIDRALSLYNVGSVFKPCVCAAALRCGFGIDARYTCNGYSDIGKTRFNCNNHSGHGSLDMTQGLAKSCNCYFIGLGRDVGASAIYDMCVRLGFNRAYSLADSVTAQAGKLPSLSLLASQPAALANLSFGQGELMLTPLHIAVMVAAVANGGLLVTPSVVASTVKDGEVTDLETAPARRVMPVEHADIIGKMMEEVVLSGTGTAARPEAGRAGGKTATAETGWYIGGRNVTQSWFAGYTDKYTVVILREDGVSGSSDCAPVFKNICDMLSG